MRKIVSIILFGFIFVSALTGCSQNKQQANSGSTAIATMKKTAQTIQKASSEKTTEASPVVNKKESFYDISYTMPESYTIIEDLSSDNEKAYLMGSGCYIYVYRETLTDKNNYLLENLDEDKERHKDENFHVESALEDGIFNGLEGGYFFTGTINADGSYTLYIHNCIPINDYCYSILYQENGYDDNNTENVEAFYKVLNTVIKNK